MKIFLVLLFLTVALQWVNGGFRAEWSGHSDEPSHYVTGLMVRDYVASWFPQPPMIFAREYYGHYPKVGLGHWPPFFYTAQAIWTLPFSDSRPSLLIMLAAITAATATTLFQVLRTKHQAWLSWAGAVLFISTPIVQEFSRTVMAEMLVTLITLQAVVAFGRYLTTQSWQHAARFGLWSSLALLTKGTGVVLAGVPVLSVVGARALALVRRPSFWLPALIVVGLCAPWYLLAPDARNQSVTSHSGFTWYPFRFRQTLIAWSLLVGVWFIPAVIAGVIRAAGEVKVNWSGDRPNATMAYWVPPAAYLVTVLAARVILASLEERHLVMSLPYLLLFGIAGLDWLITKVPRSLPAVAVLLVAMAAINMAVKLPPSPSGFTAAATDLLARQELRDQVFLVCSDAPGEGMLIAEIAMREKRPGHRIVRATKEMAEGGWMGDGYRQLFHTSEELMTHLLKNPDRIVLLDTGAVRYPHIVLMQETIRQFPQYWRVISSYKIARPDRQMGREAELIAYQIVASK